MIYLLESDRLQSEILQPMLPNRQEAFSSFSSRDELLAEVRQPKPACVIADHTECDRENHSLLHAIEASQSIAKLIAVAEQATVPDTVALLRAGAVHVIEQPIDGEQLESAVEYALNESERQLARALEVRRLHEQWNLLTDQEQSVAKLLLKGQTSEAIAGVLEISTRTVDRRRSAILSKMEENSLPELAFRLGKFDGHW